MLGVNGGAAATPALERRYPNGASERYCELDPPVAVRLGEINLNSVCKK